MPQATNYGPIGVEQWMIDQITGVTDVERRDIITQWATDYNANVDATLALLTEMTVQYQELVEIPGTAGSMQPVDDKGVPHPSFPSGSYTQAWPLQGGMTAWATNIVTRAKMTPAQVARVSLEAFQRIENWKLRHLFSALFTNVSYTFKDKAKGNLTVRPLAITADGIVYPFTNGTLGTDEHYLAQAAAIANATDPFPIIQAELAEHPSNRVSAQNPIISFVPTNLVSAIQALTAFTPVSPWHINPAPTERTLATTEVGGPGVLIGAHSSNVLIKQLTSLPDNYIVSVATGGGKAVRRRVEPEADLQDVITKQFSPDGNQEDTRFYLYEGYGPYDRVSACVYRIGNAAYAIPTGYTAPLPA